jgi:hypothetical protein
MPSINIPFPGFYESWLSRAIDSEAEQFIEYEADERETENFPEPLRLDNELGEMHFDCMRYSKSYQYMARSYARDFNTWAGDQLGLARSEWQHDWRLEHKTRRNVPSLGLTFEEMTSPRFYNFETDRLFCTISARTVKTLFRMSKAENHTRLGAEIKERCTSYDGFHSFYPNDLQTWLTKPLAEWDENELGTLLRALLPDDDNDFMQYVLDGETASNAHDEGMDWEKWEAEKMKARAGLLREWLDSDQEEALVWRSNHADTFRAIVAADPGLFPDAEQDGGYYRCELTPDMFADA